jgi:phosphate transport system permease protein
MTVGLVTVVLANGLGYFWPKGLVLFELADGSRVLGRVTDASVDPGTDHPRTQLKIGNRDLYGLDFRWIGDETIQTRSTPETAIVLERMGYGDFYGFIGRVDAADLDLSSAATPWDRLQAARRAAEPVQEAAEQAQADLTALSYRIKNAQVKIGRLKYKGAREDDPRIAELNSSIAELRARSETVNAEMNEKRDRLRAYSVVMADAGGREKSVPLDEIVRAYPPNVMSVGGKIMFYGERIVELLTAPPREANTEGGLFPAIFGTVFMVFLMSLFCIPLGVVAAIYLREYAKDGLTVRLVRIAVNNLAGVPSIVYGVFGLGFFVYGIGSWIDHAFYADRLPNPTFGTGGILWASLTLALLTVPVVIVSTEEALAAIPRGMREGSLALGATKFQTIVRILLPMASPGIMTGLILAMARAAGEVAPLMIVGVVKLAPLPVDAQFPYVHFERKFMHLGFHIYDVGFQSPNVEAAKPMVYVTTLLLLALVVMMSAFAIYLRNSMKKKYTSGVF